jgi:hypothetical protein
MIKKKEAFLLWIGIIWASVQLVSCSAESETIQASFDLANIKESGPSAEDHSPDIGINMMYEFIWGIDEIKGPLSAAPPGVNGFIPDSDQPDDLAYTAAPEKKDGIKFAAAAEFVQKGAKTNGIGSRLNYLEGQGDALYLHSFPGGNALFGGLGPYIAYGVGGKTLNMPDFGSEAFRRFDAGLNFKAGYQMDMGLRFGLGYDLGLFDKSRDPSDYTSRNRSFSVSVGYSVDKIIGAFKRN